MVKSIEVEPNPAVIKRVPGTITRQKLLDAAEAVYAERGLDGASVRMLTQLAGARLGSITEIFGSLGALPQAVIERRHATLVAQRRSALGGETSPDLARIVKSYADPLIELASEDAGWKAYSRVWAQLVSGHAWDKKLGDIIDADAGDFIALLRRAEPRLSAVEAAWAFTMMMGSVAAIYADNGRVDRLSHGLVSSSNLRAAAAKLVPYVVGGIQAMAGDDLIEDFEDKPVVRRRSRETRDVILDSAERMFAAHGFFGTSFRMIAKSSGLSVGLCQHYFDNKELLFKQTVLRRFPAMLEQRQQQLDAAIALSPGKAKLKAIYAAWLEPPARHLQMGGRGWRDHSRVMTTAINSQGSHWLDALDASHTSVTRAMVEAAAASMPEMTFESACYAHLFMIGCFAICYATEDRLHRISDGRISPVDYRSSYSKLLHFHVGGSLALAAS